MPQRRENNCKIMVVFGVTESREVFSHGILTVALLGIANSSGLYEVHHDTQYQNYSKNRGRKTDLLRSRSCRNTRDWQICCLSGNKDRADTIGQNWQADNSAEGRAAAEAFGCLNNIPWHVTVRAKAGFSTGE